MNIANKETGNGITKEIAKLIPMYTPIHISIFPIYDLLFL